jgi:protein O-mannosyl-transferase
MEESASAPGNIPEERKYIYFPFYNNSQPVFVLVIIGILFYCTSLFNENALDDGIIIHQNSYVLKGVRGIKDILTKDAYDSFYKRMNASDQLQGGRYRPLPVISYAIEQEIIGRYRTGSYLQVEDLNQNGELDPEAVTYTRTGAPQRVSHSLIAPTSADTAISTVVEENYEYNDFVDLNRDGKCQPNECFTCWDLNRNFKNEAGEDLNEDGVFNEVDCQVQGSFLRHFNNMWTYILGCVLLFILFSKYMLKNRPDVAFLAALIYLVHPLHSEAVANIKGRDEIFCLIFMSLCFIYAFRFAEDKRTVSLLSSALMLLLALLSKEFGVLLLLLVPLALYIFNGEHATFKKVMLPVIFFLVIAAAMIVADIYSFYLGLPAFLFFLGGVIIYGALLFILFRPALNEKGIHAILPVFFFTGLVYLAMRLYAVNMAPGVPDTEILNNPYLLATGQEKIATKIFILLKYLGLTIFPHPLMSDYSYNTIQYRNFSDWDFILSLLLHLALLVVGIRLVSKKHVLGIAIITYLVTLFLVGNFIFDTGAIMLEGNLFIPLIGMSMIFSWLIIAGFERVTSVSFNTKRTILLTLLCVLVTLFGVKTWERNRDWKNDVTLFLKDVNNAPNSVLVLGNAGARWIDLADTKEITGIPLPGEDPTRVNDYNGTLHITDEEVKLGGYSDKREAALQKGIGYLKHAVELHPRYVNGYLNLGLASFKLQKDLDAIYYWKLAEHLYPDNPYLQNYYHVYTNILHNRGEKAFDENRFNDAVKAYTMWTIVKPANAEAWYALGGAHFNLKQYEQARKSWEKAVKFKPGYKEAEAMLRLVSAGTD